MKSGTRRALHDEGWLPKKAKFERALSEILTVTVEATGARIQPYTKRRRLCSNSFRITDMRYREVY